MTRTSLETRDSELEECQPDRYFAVRAETSALAAPLSAEDQTVQSMPDASPTKWHQAHTSWFFETFLLAPSLPGYQVFHPSFGYLFNSYYETVGARHPRPERGLLTRPSLEEIIDYRAHIDAGMGRLLEQRLEPSTTYLIELGINHEQQHQELVLMDIKHLLSLNPMSPSYNKLPPSDSTVERSLGWETHLGGVAEIGYSGKGFAFDNEYPQHRVYLEPFALADRPVSCGDWLEFIDDDGYHRPELWLSDGWGAVTGEQWTAPLYWRSDGDQWQMFTLGGLKAVNPAEPVSHVSYFEADAYARWAGARLPTEAEWEVASADLPVSGHLLDQSVLHPRPPESSSSSPLLGMFGDVWEWTSSAYLPYPGFVTAPGAVGEYNGKFMINQHVLRGGCCVTPGGHVRATYRNFYAPGSRWAFSGLRLAKDL